MMPLTPHGIPYGYCENGSVARPIPPFTRVWCAAALATVLALAGCAICTAHPYFNWAEHAPERAAVCGRE